MRAINKPSGAGWAVSARRRLLAGLALACLLIAPARASFELAQGQWYDPARNGHGIDLQPIGPGRYLLILYTYDADGAPVWYLSDAQVEGEALAGDLGLFDYDAQRAPPQQLREVAGQFTLTEGSNAACTSRPGTVATFQWSLQGQSDTWCLRSVLNRQQAVARDFTAMYYAGESDTGWGLSLGMQSESDSSPDGGEVWVALLFYYDQTGNPVWAQAVGDPHNGPLTLNNYRGYCRQCEAVPIQVFPAGQMSLTLATERGWPVGGLDLQASYALGDGSWNRPDTSVFALTDPHPSLFSVPDELPVSETIAYLDVELVDMSGEPAILPRQTVVVRDGKIDRVGPYRSFPLPADAWRIHAPGHYLGPGLTELHLHVTYGGWVRPGMPAPCCSPMASPVC